MGLREFYFWVTQDTYWTKTRWYVEHFYWKRTYGAHTDYGYKLKYTVGCFVDKTSHEEFRGAEMWKDVNQQELIDEWHTNVFLPRLRELQCSFRFLNRFRFKEPSLCRIAKEDGEEFVFFDSCGRATCEQISGTPYLKNGCIVARHQIGGISGAQLELAVDDALIQENYDMLNKLGRADAVENSEAYRRLEEDFTVAWLHRQMELKREFDRIQTNQKLSGSCISVETKRVGNTVELSWGLSDGYRNGNFILRGYRRNDGFAPHGATWTDHGMCMVETRSDGKAVQHLEEGKEYFYTFLLTIEEPVCREQGLGDTIRVLIGSPVVTGSRIRIVDTLRLSVRVPTQSEMLRVEKMAEKMQEQPAPNPRREKINRAFEELSAFVEFDESVTQWEKELIKQIESRGYPSKERKDKIERLKLVVRDLREANEPRVGQIM